MDISQLEDDLCRLAARRGGGDDLRQQARLIALEKLADGEDDREHLLTSVWQGLGRYIYESSHPVCAPATSVSKLLLAKRELGREPGPDEVPGMTPGRVVATVNAMKYAAELTERCATCDATEDETAERVAELLDALPADERRVFELFMAGWSRKKIAREAGLTEWRVIFMIEDARTALIDAIV